MLERLAVRTIALALPLLAACAPAPVGYPPVAAPCAFNRISRVTVTGAPPSAVPQLVVLEGTVDDPERIHRIGELATGALRAEGYAGATLAIARRAGCGIELAVAIALGPRYRIASITFEPADEFPAAARLAVIEDALGTVNTIGGTYVEYRLRRALVELERRYHDAGWLDAKLGAPRARYDRAGTVAITIPVAAGPRFRIGSVRAIGAGRGARQAVLHTLALRAGDYYDGAQVRTAIERARLRLDRRVELRASVAGDRSEIDLEAFVEAAR